MGSVMSVVCVHLFRVHGPCYRISNLGEDKDIIYCPS